MTISFPMSLPYSKVSPEFVARVKGLKMTFLDRPQPELLIPVPNPCPKVDYMITVTSPEYTSLCPLAPTQPDFATIVIEYWPKKFIVELKSLKFYLASYRNVEIFHEAVVGNIIEDLFVCCMPKYMTVKGDFTIRGGIHTLISAKKGILL